MKISDNLPFWLNQGEVLKIAQLFEKWWTLKQNIFWIPLKFFDEDNAPESIIKLRAFERNVTRLKGEPFELFRKRVKYAYLNYQDAGNVAGFKRIFKRLGVGDVEIEERFDETNWDVIRIILQDEQLTLNSDLISLIIREYGRTCRRYQFVTESRTTVPVRYSEFSGEWHTEALKN